MMKKNKNLIILLLVIVGIILAVVYACVQAWSPIKTENNSAMPTTEKPVAQNISVSLEVVGTKYQTQVKIGTTVYDLMNDLQATQGLSFSANEYSGMGSLVEEINGVKNDVKANKFWFYYINGQSANEGISSYVLKNYDVIIWKYEVSKF